MSLAELYYTGVNNVCLTSQLDSILHMRSNCWRWEFIYPSTGPCQTVAWLDKIISWLQDLFLCVIFRLFTGPEWLVISKWIRRFRDLNWKQSFTLLVSSKSCIDRHGPTTERLAKVGDRSLCSSKTYGKRGLSRGSAVEIKRDRVIVSPKWTSISVLVLLGSTCRATWKCILNVEPSSR